MPSIAHANFNKEEENLLENSYDIISQIYNEENENLLETSYNVISQIYNQQNLELSSPICTSDECTSCIISDNTIIGFISAKSEKNINNNAIKFSYKEYSYENQQYSDSFLVILKDGENKYYTESFLADYSFNNGTIVHSRNKRGISVRCNVSYDSGNKVTNFF